MNKRNLFFLIVSLTSSVAFLANNVDCAKQENAKNCANLVDKKTTKIKGAMIKNAIKAKNRMKKAAHTVTDKTKLAKKFAAVKAHNAKESIKHAAHTVANKAKKTADYVTYKTKNATYKFARTVQEPKTSTADNAAKATAVYNFDNIKPWQSIKEQMSALTDALDAQTQALQKLSIILATSMHDTELLHNLPQTLSANTNTFE